MISKFAARVCSALAEIFLLCFLIRSLFLRSLPLPSLPRPSLFLRSLSLLALLLVFSSNAAATISYSGSVNFPPGTSATSETRTILVVAENPANIAQNQILTVPFIVGQTAADYTITLPDNGHDWRLRYSCSLCNAAGVLTQGFYSSSGSVSQASNATILSGDSSQSGIDIDLLTGVTISGELAFPSGNGATSQSRNILVIAENPLNISENQILNVSFAIGQNASDYTIVLPDNGHDWRVRYQCSLCNAQGLLTEGYYSTNGTVTTPAAASTLAGGVDHSNIDIQLTAGRTIAGELSFPSGLGANSFTRSIIIRAENPTNIAQNQLLIVSFNIGQASADYTITLPDNGHDWRISYQCALCNQQGIVTAGYYSSSGTVTSPGQASILPGDIDSSGIDINLVQGRVISGELSFPSGIGANNQTATVLVVAENPLNIAQNQILSVDFNLGQNSRDYAITLPDNGHDWRLRYQCTLCNSQSILTEGFYSSAGTVTEAAQATILSGAIDHANINVDLIGGLSISGELSFPPGIGATSQTRNVLVVAENPLNITQNQIVNVVFAVGRSSRDYTITIPSNGHDWRVRYQCTLCNASGVVTQGFYSSAGTVGTAAQATVLTGAQSSSGIDIQFLGLATPGPSPVTPTITPILQLLLDQ